MLAKLRSGNGKSEDRSQKAKRERRTDDSWRRAFLLMSLFAVWGHAGWWSADHRPQPRPATIGYDSVRNQYAYLPPGQIDVGAPNADDRRVAAGDYITCLFTIDGGHLDLCKQKVYARTQSGSQAMDEVDSYYNGQDTNPFVRQPNEHVAVQIDGVDMISEVSADVSYTLTELTPQDRQNGRPVHKRAHVEMTWVPDFPPDKLALNPSRLVFHTLRVTVGPVQ